MTYLLLLLSTALASDVVYVPAGGSVQATAASYLLPEPMFSKCLSDAQILRDVVSPGLSQCQSVCSSALSDASTALQVCQRQFDLDQDRVADLVGYTAGLETSIIKLRNQRNVAWAVAGSLLVGSTAAMILANTLE